MRNKLSTFTAALAVLVIGCRETEERQFANQQAIVVAGAIDRGWIPDWLPLSARDIRERHRVDSPSTLVMFYFNEEDRERLEGQCEPTVRPHRRPSPSVLAGVRWWPKELVNPDRRTSDRGFRYFRCDEQEQFGDGHIERRATGLAVRTDQPVAFFWR